jgi:hypothetical protein
MGGGGGGGGERLGTEKQAVQYVLGGASLKRRCKEIRRKREI